MATLKEWLNERPGEKLLAQESLSRPVETVQKNWAQAVSVLDLMLFMLKIIAAAIPIALGAALIVGIFKSL